MPGPSDATPVVEAQKRAAPEFKAVAEFLRGKNGPKVRRGVLNGKRVDYFKGKTALRVLQGPAYQKAKGVPKVENEEEAVALLGKVLPNAFFLRVDRPGAGAAISHGDHTHASPPSAPGQPKPLLLSPQQAVAADAYYAWFYDGSPLYTYLGGAAMVVIMLAGVMFPLWPVKLRIGVWYLSVAGLGCVGALIVLAIIRLIIYIVTVLSMKRAIWIFPNLFEDVGFIDSFIPAWAYDEPAKKKKKRPAGYVSKRGVKGKKHSGADGEAGGEGEGSVEGDAGVEGVSSAVDPVDVLSTQSAGVGEGAQGPGLRHRQQATVEEVEDDE